eukprot:1142650-Pelagomonas_calceolata.AAC.4
MYPAVLPTAPEATKLGCPDRKFCLVCIPSLRADGGLAGSGPKLPAKSVANVSAAPATASDAPLTLQGGGCAGRARAARYELYRKLAKLGAYTP